MRVWLAGIFVVFSIATVVGLLSDKLDQWPVWMTEPIILAVFILSSLASMALFNRESYPNVDIAAYERQLKDWRESGQIASTEYSAKRAFEVEEFEDEGQHFFLELADGSILYLSGQYLYDLTDAEQLDEGTPLFPCSEFTIEFHLEKKWFISMQRRGHALDVEGVAAEFWNNWPGEPPEDGDIITTQTYDQIRSLAG